jgi:uracil-DNA glycosylase
VARILRNDWADKLNDQFEMPYYLALRQFLIQEYRTTTVYPDMYDIFNALHYTPYAATKVCILGQDPYHGPGQAHGLSFSVKPGVPPPPSLQNILRELEDDLGCPIPNHGCLEKWAREGVLLLNTVLTVRRGQANSHAGQGWEHFTDRVVEVLNEREDPVVFVLWGRNAQAKKSMIDMDRHCIIESAHPSPFSAHRGFFGSRPFSRANRFLQQIGKEPVDWNLENMALPATGM